MSNTLQNKVVILTGASSGFGAEMAAQFGAAGAKLLLIARNADKLELTTKSVKNAGGTAIALAGDVTQSATFDQALALALEQWGKVDILINNAGGGVKIAPVEEQTPEAIAQCLALNLQSVIDSCRIIAPQMKQQRSGLIINITSACANFAWPGWSVYSAAKAGVAMFSRCLYTELRPYGIQVTNLVPGGSNTGFQSSCDITPFEWDDCDSLRPEHIAHAALSLARMPAGAVVPEIVVYGQSQEIVPF